MAIRLEDRVDTKFTLAGTLQDRKWDDAADAVRNSAGTGRLFVLEEDRKNPRIFLNPERVIDFIRMVTEDERRIE